MGAIKVLANESLLSKELVLRYQNSTDPNVDLLSSSLLEIFYKKFADQKEKLIAMRKRSLDEVNDFLTIDLSDTQLGFEDKKHPARLFERTETYLDHVISYPYVMFQRTSGGKTTWATMPLIKAHIKKDGKHLITYNDCLLYHINPEENAVPIPISLIKEIKKVNVVAGILFEEACHYKNWYNNGKSPFFDFTEKQLREKLLFDKMEVAENGQSYETVKIKSMRIDNIRKKVLEPALKVLQVFFNEGKTEIFLEVEFFLTKAKKEGRPPKRNFRFVIKKEKKSQTNGVQEQELQFDYAEEITPLYEIKKELIIFVRKKALREIIAQQIEERESKNTLSAKEVLNKILEKKTALSREDYKKGSYLLRVLWEDFQLGEEPPTKREKIKLEQVPEWKNFSLEEKIQFMQDNMLLQDRASDMGLSVEETKNILSGTFKDYVVKNGKPLVDWNDAYSLFFSWMIKINSKKNNKYGNSSSKGKGSDGVKETAIRFFDD